MNADYELHARWRREMDAAYERGYREGLFPTFRTQWEFSPSYLQGMEHGKAARAAHREDA